MTSDIYSALVRIQQRVVQHYNELLRQNMTEGERRAIRERLGREEAVLSELTAGRTDSRERGGAANELRSTRSLFHKQGSVASGRSVTAA